MWWAYTRGGLYSGGAYSRRFTVLECCDSLFSLLGLSVMKH